MIRWSCHNDNFGPMPAAEAFRFIKMLEYDAVDVSVRGAAPFEEIFRDPEGFGARIRALADETGLGLSELFAGTLSVDGRAIVPTMPEAVDCDALYREFNQVFRFARSAGLASIMTSVGNAQPDEAFEASFERAGAVLEKLSLQAADYGLKLHVEPTRTSILQDPDRAEAFMQLAPHLGYTLDLLHYQINGIGAEHVVKLLPYSGHLHIRQARRDVGKCAYEEGEIDYRILAREIVRTGWQGDIASEFWCDEAMTRRGLRPVEQNLVMRYMFRNMLREAGCTGC